MTLSSGRSSQVTPSPGKLWGLRRLADASGRFKMLAVDQRPPIKQRVAQGRGEAEARFEDVRAVKASLMKALAPLATATLADPHYALVDALTLVPASSGLIGTQEDSAFIDDPEGRISREIDQWNVGKMRRLGCDGVKVLTWYRPDASARIRKAQQDFTRRVGEACAAHDIPFVFELLLYPLPGDAHQTRDYVEQVGKRAEQVIESVQHFAGSAFGVDLFKLESPLAAADLPDPEGQDQQAVERCRTLFSALNNAAARPWVMLSAGASQAAFRRVLHYAYGAGASGFLAGRAIWWQALDQTFPDLSAFEAELRGPATRYFTALNQLTDQAACPWTDWYPDLGQPHPGPGFRQHYADAADHRGFLTQRSRA